jgi:hypothetical protein
MAETDSSNRPQNAIEELRHDSFIDIVSLEEIDLSQVNFGGFGTIKLISLAL